MAGYVKKWEGHILQQNADGGGIGGGGGVISYSQHSLPQGWFKQHTNVPASCLCHNNMLECPLNECPLL